MRWLRWLWWLRWLRCLGQGSHEQNSGTGQHPPMMCWEMRCTGSLALQSALSAAGGRLFKWSSSLQTHITRIIVTGFCHDCPPDHLVRRPTNPSLQRAWRVSVSLSGLSLLSHCLFCQTVSSVKLSPVELSPLSPLSSVASVVSSHDKEQSSRATPSSQEPPL